jgi:hypothetical protein
MRPRLARWLSAPDAWTPRRLRVLLASTALLAIALLIGVGVWTTGLIHDNHDSPDGRATASGRAISGGYASGRAPGVTDALPGAPWSSCGRTLSHRPTCAGVETGAGSGDQCQTKSTTTPASSCALDHVGPGPPSGRAWPACPTDRTWSWWELVRGRMGDRTVTTPTGGMTVRIANAA